MTPTRRQALALAASAGLGLGLAGCAPQPGGAARTAARRVDGPTLKIWADSEFLPSYAAASRGFTERYGVNLEFQPLAFNDIQTQFLQAAPSGNGPDIIDAAVDWLPAFTRGGLLAPIELGDAVDAFEPRAIAGMSQDERLLGLPVTTESINVWRNTDLIPDPVASWDEMSDVAARLKAKGVRFPFAMENAPTNAYLFIGMITAFGGYCFKQDGDSYDPKDVGLDNAGGVASLAWLAKAMEQKWTAAGLTGDVITKSFEDGQVGIDLSGPWRLGTYEPGKVPFAIDTIPAGPGGPSKPFLGCRGWMVNRLGSQVELARTFLTEYWAAKAPMKQYADATAKVSAYLPAAKEPGDRYVKAFAATAQHAEVIPTLPELAAYWPSVGRALDLTFQRSGVPSKTLMQQAAKAVRSA